MKPEVIHAWCDRQIRQKEVWLETFGPGQVKHRPDLAEEKLEDFHVLEAIRADFGKVAKIETPAPTQKVKYTRIIEWCTDTIRARHRWIDKYDRGRDKRPDHEIDDKKFDLDVLFEVRDQYEHLIK